MKRSDTVLICIFFASFLTGLFLELGLLYLAGATFFALVFLIIAES